MHVNIKRNTHMLSFCFAQVSRLENVCCCMINEVIIGENHWGSNPGAYLITNFLPSVSLPFPTLTLHHFSRLALARIGPVWEKIRLLLSDSPREIFLYRRSSIIGTSIRGRSHITSAHFLH